MSESRQPGENPQPGDKFHVVLIAPSRRAFAGLMQKHDLDLGPLNPQRDSQALEVHFFAPQEQIEALRELGWPLEVRENMSAEGRQRQQEVGRGDRFEAGKKPPQGLGKKIRE